MPPARKPGDNTLAFNRRARYEYSIVETLEAGIELTGTEVKSLRTGRIQLREGYVRVENGQAWLMQVNIASYQHGNRNNPEPERRRRLLLHKREIEYLDGRVRTQGLTIIPLQAVPGSQPGQGRDRPRAGQEALGQASGRGQARCGTGHGARDQALIARY